MKIFLLLQTLLFPLLAFAGPVNINTADAESIARELSGIGLARAQAIIEYRNEFGAFDTAEELVKVRGIGSHLLNANLGNIKVAD
jgi:competence protein ComEA